MRAATVRRGGAYSVPGMPMPIVLDCDPGHDDAVAILLAAGNDAIDLRAISTVGGNGTLDRTTINARRVAALAGLHDVPLAAGADGPKVGELRTAPSVHGESGLDGYEMTSRRGAARPPRRRAAAGRHAHGGLRAAHAGRHRPAHQRRGAARASTRTSAARSRRS